MLTCHLSSSLFVTGRPKGYVGVKSPMFSFTRLRGADPVLGVEMASTGEVACFGANHHEAFLKALISTGFKVPEKNILISVQDSLRDEVIHSAFQLHELGYNLYATKATYDFLTSCHVPCHLLHYPNQPEQQPNVLNYLRGNKIDLVINLPTPESKEVSKITAAYFAFFPSILMTVHSFVPLSSF